MAKKKLKTSTVYLITLLVFGIFIAIFTYNINITYVGFHFQIDTSSVSLNNTEIVGSLPSNTSVVISNGNVVFAKIALQNVPTVINGINAASSIIVGFSGAIIGIMVREFFKNDNRAKRVFLGIVLLFVYAFSYQLFIYSNLVNGLLDLALRYSF